MARFDVKLTTMENREKGAWIIHHTNKLEKYATQGIFENTYLAGKCGKLLSALTGDNSENHSSSERVKTLAEACKINGIELKSILTKLKGLELIDVDSNGNVQALGITTTNLLLHTSSIYKEENPSGLEEASIFISEYVSKSPMNEGDLKERIGDEFLLTNGETNSLMTNVEQFNLVDSEKLGDEKLLFNGNIFRRESIDKYQKVISSLSSDESRKVIEVSNLIDAKGCIDRNSAQSILGDKLFEKLWAINFYDVSSVSNSTEKKYFITKPSAFAKYGDSVSGDPLDDAKALVSALTYGMIYSPSNRGRIMDFTTILGSLISGNEIGPATAIGQDYSALEFKGVVRLRRDPVYPSRFHMKLLKKEVGIQALEVLSNGDAVESAVFETLNSRLQGYQTPESNREQLRKQEVSALDKISIAEKLSTLRD